MKNLLQELLLTHQSVRGVQLKIVKLAVNRLNRLCKRKIEFSVHEDIEDNYYWIFIPNKVAFVKKVKQLNEQIRKELKDADAKFNLSFMPQATKRNILDRNVNKEIVF